MVNIKRAAMASVIAVAAAVPFFMGNNASAVGATFKDWTELKTVDAGYQASQIFYTDQTTISGVADGVYYDEIIKDYKYYYYGEEGKETAFLIKNSTAKDRAGNPVDVVVRINNINKWIHEDDSAETLHDLFLIIDANVEGTAINESGNIQNVKRAVTAGDPITIWANSHNAEGDFEIQYVVAGSAQVAGDTGQKYITRGTPANVNQISYVAWDFDVAGSPEGKTDTRLFKGYEGVIDLGSGDATYYYDTSATSEIAVADASYGGSIKKAIRMKELSEDAYDTGDSEVVYYLDKTIKHYPKIDGFYHRNGYASYIDNASDAALKFHYTARGAGVGLAFVSAVPANPVAPEKYIVDDTMATGKSFYYFAKKGGTYTYGISQKIPTIYGDSASTGFLLQSMSSYTNIPSSQKFAEFIIEDVLDSSLTVTETPAVVRKNGEAVDPEHYQIHIDSSTNTLTIAFDPIWTNNEPSFYGSTIDIQFQVKMDESIEKEKILNKADSKFRYERGTGFTDYVTLSSNEATAYVSATLTVRHINKETEEAIADDEITVWFYGDPYKTSALEKIPDGLQLVGVPDNAEGTITGDTVVIYYYGKPEEVPSNPKTFDGGIVAFVATIVGAGAVATPVILVAKKRR